MLIRMLACYLTWHLQRGLGPAHRSAAAQAKAFGQHDPAGRPYRSFRGLLEHLATLTRNQVGTPGTQVTISTLTEPTSTQRQAFYLLGAAIRSP